MEHSKYKCCRCEKEENDLILIVKHCVENHQHDELKYRELVLDEHTGKLRYQSKLHEGIVPSRLKEDGKSINVRDNQTFVCDDKSKRKKINTPIKVQSNVPDNDDYDLQNDLQCMDDPDEISQKLQEMSSLIPFVLRLSGQWDTWTVF